MKAKLASLDRPSKSQRRLDARRKILLGAFILEQLEHAGSTPQALTFEGKRFVDWLIRPNDRAVFEIPTEAVTGARSAAAVTVLNVPFAAKDQAKALGAHWQPDQKRWVVSAGIDLAPFAAWLD